jgi:hypothetical protein
MTVLVPTLRTYPKDDGEFASDVQDAIVTEHGDVDEVIIRLRTKYPAARIAVRNPLARVEGEDVWYCYRDGKVILTSDGAGAMRLWTPIERETRRSLDLIEWADRTMRESRRLLSAAHRAGATTSPSSIER